LSVADRDLGLRLPEVELAELGRSIDGALVGALGTEDRAQLAQVIIENRLGASVTGLFDQLADSGVGDSLDLAEQAGDLLAVGIELGSLGGTTVARWLLGADRPTDRLSIAAGSASDLLDPQPIYEMHATDLRPLLHLDQLLLLASASLTGPGCDSHRTPEGGQFSTGQGWGVFRRRLHSSRPSARLRSFSRAAGGVA
jgi:hypothetical protein